MSSFTKLYLAVDQRAAHIVAFAAEFRAHDDVLAWYHRYIGKVDHEDEEEFCELTAIEYPGLLCKFTELVDQSLLPFKSKRAERVFVDYACFARFYLPSDFANMIQTFGSDTQGQAELREAESTLKLLADHTAKRNQWFSKLFDNSSLPVFMWHGADQKVGTFSRALPPTAAIAAALLSATRNPNKVILPFDYQLAANAENDVRINPDTSVYKCEELRDELKDKYVRAGGAVDALESEVPLDPIAKANKDTVSSANDIRDMHDRYTLNALRSAAVLKEKVVESGFTDDSPMTVVMQKDGTFAEFSVPSVDTDIVEAILQVENGPLAMDKLRSIKSIVDQEQAQEEEQQEELSRAQEKGRDAAPEEEESFDSDTVVVHKAAKNARGEKSQLDMVLGASNIRAAINAAEAKDDLDVEILDANNLVDQAAKDILNGNDAVEDVSDTLLAIAADQALLRQTIDSVKSRRAASTYLSLPSLQYVDSRRSGRSTLLHAFDPLNYAAVQQGGPAAVLPQNSTDAAAMAVQVLAPSSSAIQTAGSTQAAGPPQVQTPPQPAPLSVNSPIAAPTPASPRSNAPVSTPVNVLLQQVQALSANSVVPMSLNSQFSAAAAAAPTSGTAAVPSTVASPSPSTPATPVEATPKPAAALSPNTPPPISSASAVSPPIVNPASPVVSQQSMLVTGTGVLPVSSGTPNSLTGAIGIPTTPEAKSATTSPQQQQAPSPQQQQAPTPSQQQSPLSATSVPNRASTVTPTNIMPISPASLPSAVGNNSPGLQNASPASRSGNFGLGFNPSPVNAAPSPAMSATALSAPSPTTQPTPQSPSRLQQILGAISFGLYSPSAAPASPAQVMSNAPVVADQPSVSATSVLPSSNVTVTETGTRTSGRVRTARQQWSPDTNADEEEPQERKVAGKPKASAKLSARQAKILADKKAKEVAAKVAAKLSARKGKGK